MPMNQKHLKTSSETNHYYIESMIYRGIRRNTLPNMVTINETITPKNIVVVINFVLMSKNGVHGFH